MMKFGSIEEMQAWFAADPEPVPFRAFDLSDAMGRREFLRELYWRGKPALFEAVSHAWDALEAPKAPRAAAIADAASLAGAGKPALYHALLRFVDDALAIDRGLPPITRFTSFEEWNEAVFRCAEEDACVLEQLLDQWAAILMGQTPPPQGATGPTVESRI